MQVQLDEGPTAGASCPGCGMVSSATRWRLPKGPHASEPGRQRWECYFYRCAFKPAANLPVWNEGTVDKKARQKLLRAAEKAAKKIAEQQSLEPSRDGPPEQSTQLAAIRQELANIRANHAMIIDLFSVSQIGSGQAQTIDLLNLIQTACDQLDREAKAFHRIHEQHNDAINTILLFLAKTCEKDTQ